MTVEISPQNLQSKLDHALFWGTSKGSSQMDVWQPEPPITVDDVIIEGIGHACRVIKTVLDRPDSLEDQWRAYRLKNKAYHEIGEYFEGIGRQDLLQEWQKGESRKNKEKTHWDLRNTMQVPQNVDKQRIEPVVRMLVYYICNTLRTLELTAHGKKPDLARTENLQKKYVISLEEYRDCFEKAHDLDDLCAHFAVQTAAILHGREINNEHIATILTSCFANTGLIREYGQQKHAEKIVDNILSGIISSGKLPGLAQKFRTQARANVRRFYFDKPNKSLLKT